MRKILLWLALLLAPMMAQAASNCPAYTYVLQNGTLADANQVMANFNTILNCANTNLATSGANTNITSLSGLTTALSQAQGGTGNTNGQPSGSAGGVLGGTYPNPTFAPAGATTIMANTTAFSNPPVANTPSAVMGILPAFVGDTGTGGLAGVVPAPPAGSAAAGKVLGAGGTWTSGAFPSGSIIMYGANSSPTGWLICNGAAVSRTTYATLFAAIGTTFGAGDGSTTFNLPDFRGQFARGFDTSGLIDPGRTFGTTQTDQMQGHYHSATGGASFSITGTSTGVSVYVGNNSPNLTTSTTTAGPASDGTNGTPRVGKETRPTNVAISYIIKTAYRPANDNHRIRLQAA